MFAVIMTIISLGIWFYFDDYAKNNKSGGDMFGNPM